MIDLPRRAEQILKAAIKHGQVAVIYTVTGTFHAHPMSRYREMGMKRNRTVGIYTPESRLEIIARDMQHAIARFPLGKHARS